MPGSVVRLSVELQTPGLPEGQEEGRLAFSLLPPSALPSLSIRPLSLSFSLSHFHTLSLSLSLSLFSSNLEKTAAVQPVHRHPTLAAQPIPSIMVYYSPLFVWMQLEREKLRTLWVNDFETIYPESPRPPYQLKMSHNLQ